jgi:spoIIIJ-associated protein
MATVRLTTAARPLYQRAASYSDDDDMADEGVLFVPKTQKIPESEISEDLRVGREKLRHLLEIIGYDNVEITVEKTEGGNQADESYILQVQGEELRNLIGRRGESLAALQYITRLVASRDLQRRANFVVDVGDYKSSRAQKLYQLANRMANQAVERRRIVKLEPMPPHERRIIHMALRQRGDVTTSSVGEGKFRKVTIVPNKF